jgi:hypothetical protein
MLLFHGSWEAHSSHPKLAQRYMRNASLGLRRASRVEVNLVTQRSQLLTRFGSQAIVPTLEHVSAFAPEPDKAGGERALKPLHVFDQVRVGVVIAR